ncbi:BON domain-containing protein [Roseateles sp. LYH14W]|uniref:BON domain-containing protein n=1 Tax=Pelomonas parva TaxID=3299032 RepID=A0ABW7F9H3_9BURK
MKFPKSIHAEGWADHIDATPGALSGTPKPAAAKTRLPLRGAKLPASAIRLDSQDVPPSLSSIPPTTVGVSSAIPRGTAGAAALPPQRENQRGWMIAAGAGAAVIAAVALWSVNRPSESPSTPPAIVTGSAAPQAEVAAAVPVPEPAVPSQADAETGTATTVAAAEPARLGPPVTTVKPAPESRPVAQATLPAPRPDLVVRANPRNDTPAAQPKPYLQPIPPVAAAPATEVQPLAVTPDTTPITLPPTAAGPTPATAPLAAVTPVPAASATLPVTPPLAQAPMPSPEDTGITQQVRSALAADSTLAAVPIAVSTDQGVVKLEGQAPDAPTRERATVVASSASGVKAVDNRLTLAPAPMLSQAPSGL